MTETVNKPKSMFTAAEIFFLVVTLAIVILVVGYLRDTGERERIDRTRALIASLEAACASYHTRYGAWPPGEADSRCLHRYLGAGQPPIMQFTPDMLQGQPTQAKPDSPVPVIDAWDKPIRYANPGVRNPKGVDIWSESLEEQKRK